jgi:BMFP domain-containing protein YqiC
MMQSENPLIADFVKMMNSAAGTVAGMAREAGESGKERIKDLVGGMDFVSREEFDTVKAMAAKALDENEKLKNQLDLLQARLNGQGGL